MDIDTKLPKLKPSKPLLSTKKLKPLGSKKAAKNGGTETAVAAPKKAKSRKAKVAKVKSAAKANTRSAGKAKATATTAKVAPLSAKEVASITSSAMELAVTGEAKRVPLASIDPKSVATYIAAVAAVAFQRNYSASALRKQALQGVTDPALKASFGYHYGKNKGHIEAFTKLIVTKSTAKVQRLVNKGQRMAATGKSNKAELMGVAADAQALFSATASAKPTRTRTKSAKPATAKASRKSKKARKGK